MTTSKGGKGKKAAPPVKVVDLDIEALKSGEGVEGKDNPKGGNEVRRYDIVGAFPKLMIK